jgi:hypothetical protein
VVAVSFDSLSPVEVPSEFPRNMHELVRNLSSIQLTTTHLEALSLGLKFALPRNNMSDTGIDSQFENLYNQLKFLSPTSEENQSWLKNKLVDIASHYRKHHPACKGLLKR